MNWIKKWYYLLLLVSVGVLYLAGASGWQVYAQPPETGADAVRTPEPAADGSDIQQTSGEVAEGDGTSSGDRAPLGDREPSGDGMPQGEGTPSGEGTAPGEGTPKGDGTSQPVDDPEGGKTDNQETDGQNESEETGFSYMTVEDDYFADAVFIGDSRTVGMSEYGGLEDIAAFYASKGLTVHKMFTSEIVPVRGQKKKITVEEALQENTFSKIYLMIGINEMGTGTVDTFMEKYEQAVRHLQELQPDAVIYLQGIMKVTTKRSEKGDYITNEGIEERNERIAQLADDKKVFYLDVNPMICDETEGMMESYTYDGVHLKGKHIEIWKQFLKEHAVAR